MEDYMRFNKTPIVFLLTGMALLLAASLALATATPASAQCGSQASSCKNCHEVQGQDPVNADGTAWHQSHAFGDFCYICHAGNNQAKDITGAHEGMVPPLSDIKASCQQCHAADLETRAQVYATTLGVDLTAGFPADSTAASDTTMPASAAAVSANSVPSCNDLVVNDPNAINYIENYDQIILGKKPINWGNSILMVMIGLIAVGGGGFVITREKLVNVAFGDTRKVDNEYPADVVEMLPKIAGLKTKARKSLKNVLNNPDKANKVLDLMDAVISEETGEE
jgi:hypothetical protein